MIFTYISYTPQEIAIDNKSTIDVQLKSTAAGLNSVVVVGYGTQKKRDLTGSVSHINVSEQATLPQVNPVQTLRGKVAGVNIRDNGRPGGAGAAILIRGQNSINASTYPLIVLDGIPYNGSLADINTNDIETIDVLKDASSTSIYGSRASNGVILVTTKAGKSGKPTINFNTYNGFADYSHRIKLFNGPQYLQSILDFRAASGLPADPANIKAYLQTNELANYSAGHEINAWDEIKQPAPLSNYELSVSGKNNTTTYFTSASYTTEKGITKGDQFKRVSIRANIANKINDWLDIGLNSFYSNRDNSGGLVNMIYSFWLSPYASLYKPEGSLVFYPQNDQLVASPFLASRNINKQTNQTLSGTLYGIVNFPFIKGLSYRVNYSYNFTPSLQDPASGINLIPSGFKSEGISNDWLLENILTYARKIKGIHSIDATLLYSKTHSENSNTGASNSGFFTDVLNYNNLGLGTNPTVSSSASASDGISYMARLNYRLLERYLLTATVRKDGFSGFGPNKKYGTFPSMALGWVISDEKFMHLPSFVDFLKIRYSYGKTGNQGIGPYSSIGQLGQGQYVFGDGGSTVPTLFANTLGNQDLGWESTYESNLGLDFNLLKDKITGSIELYNTHTKDLLLRRTIPVVNGFASVFQNVGETNNKGFELTLNSTNLKTKNFEWSSTITFWLNRNKIVHLYNVDLNHDGKEDDDIGNSWFIGQPITSVYDYVLDGVYQKGDVIPARFKPGFYRIKDLNGDSVINSNDRTIIGNRDAKYQLGFNNNFRYKSFTLSAFINYRQGGILFDPNLNPANNFPSRVNALALPYWTPENQLTDRPVINYANPLGHGFYENLSFVRIQDVSLSYDFSQKLLQKIKVSQLRMYVSGKNLATFTEFKGWDPESQFFGNNGYPMTKSFVAGLNINF